MNAASGPILPLPWPRPDAAVAAGIASWPARSASSPRPGGRLGQGNASEPAIAFTSIDRDGREHTEVITRYGALFGDMPRPADEETPR